MDPFKRHSRPEMAAPYGVEYRYGPFMRHDSRPRPKDGRHKISTLSCVTITAETCPATRYLILSYLPSMRHRRPSQPKLGRAIERYLPLASPTKVATRHVSFMRHHHSRDVAVPKHRHLLHHSHRRSRNMAARPRCRRKQTPRLAICLENARDKPKPKGGILYIKTGPSHPSQHQPDALP